jgi:hypothetical protein
VVKEPVVKEKSSPVAAPAEKPPADKAEKAPAAKAPADKAPAAKTQAPAIEPAPVEKAGKVPAEKPGSSKVGGYALMGVGAAMLGTGAAINFLVVNSAWNDGQRAIEAPSTVSPAEAQAIEARFNTGRWATIALLAGGAISVGTGVVLGPLHTSWTLSPAGVGVHGIW